MGLDLFLAILHHFLAFGLAATLMSEGVLLRRGVQGATIDQLGRLDVSYGASAGILVIIGVLRVIFGAKGYQYYVANPWFWAKMVSFAIVGLLSIPPTMRILAWRKQRKLMPTYAPPASEVSRVVQFVRVESLFLLLVIVFAATMARYI
jgi:putative membrane protein